MKFVYKVFSTSNTHYLYDGISENILLLNNEFYTQHSKIFEHFENGVSDDFKLELEAVRSSIQNKLLVPKSNEPLCYGFDETEFCKSFRKEMSHLMLGITENCNMRCHYCVYGGHYANERTHSAQTMTKETGKAAVDFFIRESKSDELILNFYGGEPFTNFSVLQNIYDYAREKQPSLKTYITTNGTLLEGKIADWFLQNENVHLYVSLAGNRQSHDDLRVFANGAGTFATIHKNLLHLKERNLKAYTERIHFIFNIFDEQQLFDIRKFLLTDELFTEQKFLPEITGIDCLEDDGTVSSLKTAFLEKNSNGNSDTLSEYIRLLQQGKHDDVFVKYYDEKFIPLHRRAVNDSTNFISGVCRPFAKKLFVDVNGSVHICENFLYGTEFGSIFERLNDEPLKTLFERFKTAKETRCSECWASKLCGLCYKDFFDKNGNMNNERTNRICTHEKNAIENTLREYCTILETDANLLDHLDKYVLYQ